MTRTRNNGQVGTVPVDADVDADLFTRTLLEVVQDFNYVYDIVTGNNTPTISPPVVQTMVHDGSALGGSLLAVPAVNQVLAVRTGMSEADAATFGKTIYLGAFPLFVSKGERYWAFELDALSETFAVTVEIYDSTGAQISDPLAASWDGEMWGCFPQFVTTGAWYTVAFRANVGSVGSFSIRGVRMYPTTPLLGVYASAPAPSIDGSAFPVAVATGTISVPQELLHDQMFVDNYALAGNLGVQLNRGLNALYEAMTGLQVPGNAAPTNSDSGDPNPTTSRFVAKTRAGADATQGFTAEPVCDFPIGAEMLGAFMTTGDPVVENADPPVTGMPAWFCPYPKAVASTTDVIHRMRLHMPDFPSGGSSYLNVALLFIASGKGTPTNWQVRLNSAAGATAFTNVVRIGATIFYEVVFTGVPFTPDAGDMYAIEMKSAGAFVFAEIGLAGWGAAFNAH